MSGVRGGKCRGDRGVRPVRSPDYPSAVRSSGAGDGGSGYPIAPLAGGAPHQPAHQRPQPGYSWRDALVLVGLGLASVGGPGGVTVAERHHRWQAIWRSLGFALIPLFFLCFGLSLTLVDAPGMPSGQNVPAVAAFLAGIAVVIWGCIWGCTRGWRMGVRFDDHGVTVRNFLRTYPFGWAEVRRFEDGLIHETRGEGGSLYFWALKVVLHDGRVVTAKGTARKKGARPQTLAAIAQAAARHSVPAALTGIAMKGGSPVYPGLYPDPGGQPGLRRWDGEEWLRFFGPIPPAVGQRRHRREPRCTRRFPDHSSNGTMPLPGPGGPRPGSPSGWWQRLEPRPGRWPCLRITPTPTL